MTLRMLAAAAATSRVLASATMGPATGQQLDPGTVEMDLSEEQLQRFAVAYVQVVQIGDVYRGQMGAAETEEARAAVQQEVEQAMVAAVDEMEGLTVEEYTLIFNQVRADAALAGQVQGHIDSLVAQ